MYYYVRFVSTCLSAFLLFGSWAQAHPVAYQGSTGIMSSFSKDMSDFEVNYSWRYWTATSAHIFRYTPGADRPDVALVQENFLLKRWNEEGFQANIYSLTGAGNSRLSGRSRAAYFAGAVVDIENRRLYFLTHFTHLRNNVKQELNHAEIRAGFAPYLGNFNDLHTWMILEASHQSVFDTKWRLTPFLRFFYQNVLWEIGSSLKGDIKLNTIIHI